MSRPVDHTTLHRTAKYFMDSGRAKTHKAAMKMLKGFGLTIHAGPEVATSPDHQTALLTLVNVARRTFLAGIEVVGLQEGPCISPLMPAGSLRDAVLRLGGKAVSAARPDWPSAVIGTVGAAALQWPSWRVTWEGWRGGVVPLGFGSALSEQGAMAFAPILAAAVCAGEVFAYHAGDHSLAGRRPAGLSLWRPGADWELADGGEPLLAYLPSSLWLIGLGNLGQAFAWLLNSLPYVDRTKVQLLLQDFDRVSKSNVSTSLLTFARHVRRRKARVVAEWLEARGFETTLDERRFGAWSTRATSEPGVALCGVDNALARASLENVGFDLAVEAGLGAGPEAFRSFSIHSFPASHSAEALWSRQVATRDATYDDRPAYQALQKAGLDRCGVALLGSRTVSVPFVGLIAASLALAELLRRLNGGVTLELASGSVLALEDVEAVEFRASTYPGAYVDAKVNRS